MRQTVPTPTQADVAYERLKAAVLTGRLLPGARIRINEIAQEFDVSLGAVREALSKLAAHGIAVATAQKGYSVPPVSLAELRDLTATRIAIEEICLRESLTQGDIDWEIGLVSAFHRLQRLPERDPTDPTRINEAWSEAHYKFHSALVAGSQSVWMLRLRGMLYDQAERYRRLSVPLRKAARDVAGEHQAIFDAAMKRDIGATIRLMSNHLNLTTDILVAAFEPTTAAPEHSGRRSASASKGRRVKQPGRRAAKNGR